MKVRNASQNILWNCQCNLIQITAINMYLALKAEVVFTCIFGFWLSQGSVAALIRWGGWSSYCHMCRLSLNLTMKTSLKSNWFLTKLHRKISWLLFYGPQCGIIMAALCNRGAIIFLPCSFFPSSFFYLLFFSSPNLSGRRADVCHTSTHGVALVRI